MEIDLVITKLKETEDAVVDDIKKAFAGEESNFDSILRKVHFDTATLPSGPFADRVAGMARRLINREQDAVVVNTIRELSSACPRSKTLQRLREYIQQMETPTDSQEGKLRPEIHIPPLSPNQRGSRKKLLPVKTIRNLLPPGPIAPNDCRESNRTCELPHASILFAQTVAEVDSDVECVLKTSELLDDILRATARALGKRDDNRIWGEIAKLNRFFEQFLSNVDLTFAEVTADRDAALRKIAGTALNKGSVNGHHELLGEILDSAIYLRDFYQANEPKANILPMTKELNRIKANVPHFKTSIMSYIRQDAHESHENIRTEMAVFDLVA